MPTIAILSFGCITRASIIETATCGEIVSQARSALRLTNRRDLINYDNLAGDRRARFRRYQIAKSASLGVKTFSLNRSCAAIGFVSQKNTCDLRQAFLVPARRHRCFIWRTIRRPIFVIP